MWAASNDGELLKGLDKELLQGHSTLGHLFEQLLGDPRPIAPGADGVIAPRKSLFNALGSTKRTDPYVVCLLLKGYRWESSNESGLELSLIHISEPTRLGMISYAVFCLK